jgi:hypothetical protein
MFVTFFADARLNLQNRVYMQSLWKRKHFLGDFDAQDPKKDQTESPVRAEHALPP